MESLYSTIMGLAESLERTGESNRNKIWNVALPRKFVVPEWNSLAQAWKSMDILEWSMMNILCKVLCVGRLDVKVI